MKHTPSDPQFEPKVRKSFQNQPMMKTFEATLTKVEPGGVEIVLPYRSQLTQQHGFLHAGAVATCLDNACGYAALSLAPSGKEVLTVEYKVNFLSPAKGTQLIARGHVTKAGKNLSVCHANAYINNNNQEKLVATMLATIIAVDKHKY
ncbi:MAG: PaaI family thioesterase [Deltaproteobacteria bacterium]|nr:PaaI family thioesterase [Deltaproteobacteria bacterium]